MKKQQGRKRRGLVDEAGRLLYKLPAFSFPPVILRAIFALLANFSCVALRSN